MGAGKRIWPPQRPLKSARQVRRWLRSQPWYGSFRKLVFMEEDRTFQDKLGILMGDRGVATIVEAFDWNLTVQGYAEWAAINRVFSEWYITPQTQFKHCLRINIER